MKGLRTIILLTLLVLAVFVLANWRVLTAPTVLSLLAFTVEAPLGLILLGAIVLFLLLFTAHAATLRTSMLLESRRHAQELKTQREIADQSESSRLKELQQQVERGFEELQTSLQTAEAGRGASLAATEQALRKTVDQAVATLSASIRELEERMNRSRPTLAPGPGERALDRRDEGVR